MKRNLTYQRAVMSAEKLIRDHGIKQLTVDPTAIARKLDIEVKPMPAHNNGAFGMLVRVGNKFGIAYATHIDNIGFKNFSIAHELGHYCLPGHIDAVLNTEDSHASSAELFSGNQYEMEADHFAARLLMPQELFKNEMWSAGEGLNAIENLAETCRTSLTATAIRYTQCAQYPMAIIVSVGDRVDFCFMSEPLKEVDGLNWLRKGQYLSANTVTFAFNQDSKRVRQADQDADVSDLQDWFGSDYSVQIEEQVRGLGRYGKTLTVLTAPDLFDKLEEIKENEALHKSWEPKFIL